MNVQSLLDKLRSQGIWVWANGDRLQCSAPSGDPKAEIVDLLRENKTGLLKYLNGPAPLSFAQQRLWFVDQIDPGGAGYISGGGFRISGPLNVDMLERALETLVERHEALRTVFVNDGDEARQSVRAMEAWRLTVEDVGDETQLAARLRESVSTGFDLQQGPLFRAWLFRLGKKQHALLFTMPHIITDGWSLGILLRELGELYDRFLLGEGADLPPIKVQYRDYARWQRGWLRGEVLEGMLSHWRERLAGAPYVLDLPTDRPRPSVQSFNGAVYQATLPRELTAQLRETSQREGATLFMTLLSAFVILLGRYSGQNGLLVGSPIANRNRSEIEPLVGFFVNSLVFRANLSGNPTIRQHMQRMREVCLDAFAHQELPFERLVEELQPQRDMSRNPLFQVMFALQNAPIERTKFAGLDVSPLRLESAGTPTDLSLEVWEKPSGLFCLFNYATDLFNRSTIERMATQFERVLVQVVEDPGRRLSEISLLSATERDQLLGEWSGEFTDYPRDGLKALFEQQVAHAPDAVAVEHEGQLLSYGELNARANQLAHYLRERGVGPDVMVAICVERGLDMVVGIVGILKAGGAYVPLDPDYPAERLAFMLEDTAVPVLLTHAGLRDRLPAFGGEVVCLDTQWDQIARQSQANPEVEVGAHHLAYVIYTSGSTGQPKGVQVPQRGVTRLVRNTNYIDIQPDDRFAQVSVISFDAATFEIWGALLNGARMVIVPRDVALNAGEFGRFLEQHGVTVMFLTTALFNVMVREAPGALGSLRTMLFGGEAVDAATVRALLRDAPPEHLLHVYGPTEVTTFATWHLVNEVGEAATTVPIGRPIANTRAYVLDEHLQPVPVGVPGELYLGGDGLARGYLNQPELTAEKFVADPFGKEPGARLYRTGDWVRWLADGTIEFIGRRDNQVKVRGFRIELGEVESALGRLSGVREAVVLVREDMPGDKRVVAYVVPEAEGGGSLGDLRQQLKSQLPDYMVPSAFVALEALPLTPNGKVDRAALPVPEASEQVRTAYEAPGTPTEEMLAGIWAELLGVERVGIHDDFFDLGGHSLLATRVLSRLRHEMQVDVPLREFFAAPTIAQLGQCIDTMRSDSESSGVTDVLALRASSGRNSVRSAEDREGFEL